MPTKPSDNGNKSNEAAFQTHLPIVRIVFGIRLAIFLALLSKLVFWYTAKSLIYFDCKDYDCSLRKFPFLLSETVYGTAGLAYLLGLTVSGYVFLNNLTLKSLKRHFFINLVELFLCFCFTVFATTVSHPEEKIEIPMFFFVLSTLYQLCLYKMIKATK